MRVLTLNLWGRHGEWDQRRRVLRDGLRALKPDLITSRWPVVDVHEVDLHVTPRTADYSCGTLIARIAAPDPFGPVLLVDHGPSWAWPAEREREEQALAAARAIDDIVAERPAHVVVGGDFNAAPDTAGMRFWTGRQSLHGMSVAYRDACGKRPRRAARCDVRPAQPPHR